MSGQVHLNWTELLSNVFTVIYVTEREREKERKRERERERERKI
jgi:hypothetical protein